MPNTFFPMSLTAEHCAERGTSVRASDPVLVFHFTFYVVSLSDTESNYE